MPMNIGWTGILLVCLIGLLIFGPSKLPQLGRAIGTTIREFRAGTQHIKDGKQQDEDYENR